MIVRKCVICGKEFECYKSDNKSTCSASCRSEYAKRRATGRIWTQEARKKMSKAAQGRNMKAMQEKATKAAQKSPKSGRFETNINAKNWHLVSPTGIHYEFRSLNYWLRKNCKELFGIEPDSREYRNTRSGLSGAKRGSMGGRYSSCQYKGWHVIPTNDDSQENNNNRSI